jgi:calcium uniporter protein, mitochondrial
MQATRSLYLRSRLIPRFRPHSLLLQAPAENYLPRAAILASRRCLSSKSKPLAEEDAPHKPGERDAPDTSSGNTYTFPAEQLSQQITPAEKAAYRDAVKTQRTKQARAPWLRAGAEVPPVDKVPSSGDKGQENEGKDKSESDPERMVVARGKLLTTPSRLLKLVVPLGSIAEKHKQLEKDGKDGDEGLEPLALLIHPEQPLSYLERLLQAEMPMVGEKGKEHVPEVSFRAPDSEGEGEGVSRGSQETGKGDENLETLVIDGKRVKIGKISGGRAEVKATEDADDGGHNLGFVRWSSSTEIGDFIRDAARTGHFALEIEGSAKPILVAVPSFKDRTFYLRMRLRQRGREISRLADAKRECDEIAEKACSPQDWIFKADRDDRERSG